MIPPDIMFFLHQQRHQEMVRQAEQARLARASRGRSTGAERVFQHLLWWVGGTLLSWGCAVGRAGQTMAIAEKGCSVCQL